MQSVHTRRRRRVRQSPREAGCRSGSTILQLEDIYASVIQSGTRRVFDPDVLRSEQIQFCRTYVNKLEPMGQWAEERSQYQSRYEQLERSRSVRFAKALRLFG
jgi:hypothetical protein